MFLILPLPSTRRLQRSLKQPPAPSPRAVGKRLRLLGAVSVGAGLPTGMSRVLETCRPYQCPAGWNNIPQLTDCKPFEPGLYMTPCSLPPQNYPPLFIASFVGSLVLVLAIFCCNRAPKEDEGSSSSSTAGTAAGATTKPPDKPPLPDSMSTTVVAEAGQI